MTEQMKVIEMKLLFTTAVMLAVPVAAHAQMDATKAYIDGAFAAMDTNKDGKILKPEFETFMRARLARQAEAFDTAFRDLDKSGDGQIDKTEAAAHPALLEHFAEVDSDTNGTLSKNELRAAAIAAQAAEAGAQ